MPLKEETITSDLLLSQLRHTLGKLEIALGVIDSAIVFTSEEGTIEWCNTSFDKLISKNHIQILGLNLFDLMPVKKNGSPDLFNMGCVNEVLNSSNNFNEIYEFLKDEQRTILDISVTEAHFPKLAKCFVFTIQDITEQKLNEEKLSALALRLEQTNADLERSNKELEDFAYVVSHDLKAPLRGISTIAEWIKIDYGEKLDNKGKEQIGLLTNRTKRVHDLIDGILQYSRVGRDKKEKIEVNCNEIVKIVIDGLSPKDNIEIKIEKSLPTVIYEKTRLEQVFQNLISNAIKYNDKPKTKIKINSNDEGEYWKFSIQDNGPGIEEKHYERIFQIFQTLKSRDEFESTGIGLSIVKKIIEQNRGKVWVESKVGNGCVFYFTIPK